MKKRYAQHAAVTLAAGLLLAAHPAVAADINIGVLASATGVGAAIGADVKRSADLFAETYRSDGINLIILDDASDPTIGAQRLRKLIAENHIDALVASNTSGPAMAMAQIADEEKIPTIAIAPLNLVALKSPWVFRTSQSPGQYVEKIVEDMEKNKISTVSYIGFADSWGDLLFAGLTAQAPARKLTIVAEERFKRADPSVTGQVIKVLAPKPDAVFIGAAGAPAVLPQVGVRERGYKGPIYQNAVATPEFLRVGGRSVDGALVPVGTIVVNEQLPDGSRVKPVGKTFLAAYEGKYGPETRSMFAGYAWDALNLLRQATKSVKGEQPGTAAFRAQARNALEGMKEYVGVTGVYQFSPTDHSGLGMDSLVLVRLENGNWKLVK